MPSYPSQTIPPLEHRYIRPRRHQDHIPPLTRKRPTITVVWILIAVAVVDVVLTLNCQVDFGGSGGSDELFLPHRGPAYLNKRITVALA
ncbi:hypothetical protein QC763_0021310 [Podospora pseudopauciseta]|uniref:Uncharacterized protein n=1 Tax=Podospora pseudopauciseta TaxID=2093780 RepID=A0ABR0I1C3_9PEZI|nr:hypothetical protein QC763_0021310 [Podospora pseudopauciseta]